MAKSDWEHRKTAEELEASLRNQIGHLRRAARDFDQGHFSAAEVMATHVANLVHDGKGRSILTQLGRKSAAQYLQTSPTDLAVDRPKGLAYRDRTPLARVALTRPPVYLPLGLHNIDPASPPTVKFSKWWAQPIFESAAGHRLTRQHLVMALRDQDGGSHVTGRLTNRTYHWLSTEGGQMGYRIEPLAVAIGFPLGGRAGEPVLPTRFTKVKNAHWASMRQIALELDFTLESMGYAGFVLPPPAQFVPTVLEVNLQQHDVPMEDTDGLYGEIRLEFGPEPEPLAE